VFIEYLLIDQMFFVAVIVTVIVSIVLHELAHGFAAIRLGDRTPIEHDRMNPNPLVHMGPWSIAALFIAGIAWGAMPIDPTRLRGKYGEAIVAVAGPLTNLLLCLVAFVLMGVLMRSWATMTAYAAFLDFFGTGVRPFDSDLSQLQNNLLFFLFIFGTWNFALCVFNLMPVPPLDGSHILANFNHRYEQFAFDPQHQGIFILGFMLVFMIASRVFFRWAMQFGQLIVDAIVFA